jgi:hypothetical protein
MWYHVAHSGDEELEHSIEGASGAAFLPSHEH